MQVNWKHLAFSLAVLPAAAVIFAWIGFFNIGASSGHWKITDWFLHFAMRSAVRTYSLAVDVPERLPSENIQPAAGHYARGCAICHGAPGEARSAAVKRMLPAPPDLQEILSGDKWTDAELFRIVQHGVRFTGMPAWPTQARDDEVWAMVAFLRALPGMQPADYRTLAFGDGARHVAPSEDFEAALADCARCHGEDGLGRAPSVPVIAGQRAAYLRDSLVAYADNGRASGPMQLAASETDPALFARLAEHYARLPWAADGQETGSAETRALGRRIAAEGIATRGIPACDSCHSRPDRNPVYPSLAGQKQAYLAEQLRLFGTGTRGGTAYADLMQKFAGRLEERDIEALASYFASLPPALEAPSR